MELTLDTNIKKAGLIGAILIIIGSILPWAQGIFGVSVSGLEGDGILTLIIGIISIIMILTISWSRKNQIAQRIFGIFTVLIAGAVFLNTFDTNLVSAGSGLYLTIIGGFILIFLPEIAGLFKKG